VNQFYLNGNTRRILKSQAGFGLVEAMIGMALLSVTSLMFGQLITNQNRAIQGNRALSERDILLSRLSRNAGDPLSLNASALQSVNDNPNLYHDCVLGGTTNTACNANTCSPSSPCDFTLFDAGNVKMAGPPSDPQYYDLTGEPCTPSSTNDKRCAIQAISQFSVNCGGGATTCIRAKIVTVKYTVQQNPAIALQAGPFMKSVAHTLVTQLPLILNASGSPGTIAKWVNSNRLGDSVMTENNGDIGVGTASPLARLDIRYESLTHATDFWPVLFAKSSQSNAATYFRLQNDVSKEGHMGIGGSTHAWPSIQDKLYFWAGNTNGISLDGESHSIEFFTNNHTDPNMIVHASGAVGIGVTGPSQTLDVNGHITTRGWDSVYWSRDTVTSPNKTFQLIGTYHGDAGLFADYINLGFYNVLNSTFSQVQGVAFGAQKFMVVNYSNGYVGIGTPNPSYLLHVNGTAYAAGAAGALSDARHKKHVEDLDEHTLEKVLKLRPVEFEWKNPKDKGMLGAQTGFIAQEVQKIFPSVILKNDDADQTLGIKYNELISVLTKAFQEFYRTWFEDRREMRLRIQTLEQENAQIRTYLCEKDPDAKICSH
jgi:hypothetical protein